MKDIYGLPPAPVQAARDALSGGRELTRCGRPAKSSPSCGQIRPRFLPSCWVHSTPEEQVAAYDERARLAAVVAAWSDSLAPTCHTWPVADDDRAAVAALPKLPDDELREARAVHSLIWRWQRGRCAICGVGHEYEPGWYDSNDMVLDHDHLTALVRGYLCRSCNTSELHSNRGDFEKYRDRPPALILGVAAPYEHPWYGLVSPETWLDPANYDPSRSPAYKLMGRYARHLPDTAAPR